MLKGLIVTLGVAAVVTLSTPLAASAAPAAPSAASCSGVLDTNYANSRQVTVSSTVVRPGGSVDVTFSPGYFTPGSAVSVGATLTGGSTPAVSVGSASGEGTVASTASNTGAVVASVVVPANATGALEIAGMSDAACGGVSVAVLSNSQLKTLSLDGNLASTGGNLPTVLLVSGGAAVVFGAILIGARTRARRHLQE